MPNYPTLEDGWTGDAVTDLALTTYSLWTQKKSFVDQVFMGRPYLEWIRKREVVFNGGESLTVPIAHGTNTGGQFYEGMGLITAMPQKDLCWAVYVPVQYAIATAISQEELDLNSGELALAKLLDVRLNRTIETVQATFAQVMYDGTNYDSLAPYGLRDLISATGKPGGIDSSKYTWWQSWGSGYEISGLSNPATSNCIKQMMAVFSLIDTWKRPNSDITIFCPHEFFRLYYMVLNPLERLEGGKEEQGIGVRRLRFCGIPIIPDPYCSPCTPGTSGTIYWVTDAIRYYVHANANFKTSKPQEPPEQTGIVMKHRWFGQQITEKRRATAAQTYTLA